MKERYDGTVGAIRNREALGKADPLIDELISIEESRQARRLIMIASESICSRSVREALSGVFTNIYAEGYPSERMMLEPLDRLSDKAAQLSYIRRYANRRYYKGCEIVDFVEAIAARRAAGLFAPSGMDAAGIFANVQPLSGAAANNAVYAAFLEPGERVLGMALTSGGHLTHGSDVNRSGMNYEIASYGVGPDGRLDYDRIAALAEGFRPRMIIAGYSAYPWDIDWERLREIADEVPGGAVLLADISHTAGLIAAGLCANPVGFADVVTFTTHKTLCGPRGAVILTTDPEASALIDAAVFPGEQGGPHIQSIVAKAAAFEVAASDEFRKLQVGVVENARVLGEALRARGLELAYGGTETHMVLVDLRKVETPTGQPLTGEIASRLLDLCGITCNKNTIYDDENAAHPSGLRFGTTWLTQRGFGPGEMKEIAALVARVLKNAYTFGYIYSGGEVGRGKLPFDLIEEVRGEVDRLVTSVCVGALGFDAHSGYPCNFGIKRQDDGPRQGILAPLHIASGAQMEERGGWRMPAHFGNIDDEVESSLKGAVVVDESDGRLHLVSGERAVSLLHGAATADITGLTPGAGRRSFFLDDAAELVGSALVIRLDPGGPGGDGFLLRCSPASSSRLVDWLRGLSDGYILFDEDVYKKVEGPAVVEDLSAGDRGTAWSSLSMVGPGALQVLMGTFGLPGEPPLSRATGFEHDGSDGWIFRERTEDTERLIIICPESILRSIWIKAVDCGAKPAGLIAAGRLPGGPVPAYYGSVTVRGADLAGSPVASGFDLEKAYFVGQAVLMKEVAPPPPKEPWEYSPIEIPLRRTPLYEEHLDLTRRKLLIEFAGWEMPVWYGGIAAEHEMVRTTAGLFDVAHMGVLEVTGRLAERFLDLVTTNYVPWLEEGECHYSYLLRPDGSVIDDILVYKMSPAAFIVVVNASNAEEGEAWLRAAASGVAVIDNRRPWVTAEGPVVIRNLKNPACGGDMRVDMAIQGPASRDILCGIIEDRALRGKVERLGKFDFARGTLAGVDALLSRTGYTGEEWGFEILIHPDAAVGLWRKLLDEGRDYGIEPAGLGARDSTRIEAGLPLHGHELAGDLEISPIEAGYAPFVRLHKPFFVGREACLAGIMQREREVVRFRMAAAGGKMARPGSAVVEWRSGTVVGSVTSSTIVHGVQVGMALVQRAYAKEGTALRVYPFFQRDSVTPGESLPKLAEGDRAAVALEAVVLPRFMKPDEELLADTGIFPCSP